MYKFVVFLSSFAFGKMIINELHLTYAFFLHLMHTSHRVFYGCCCCCFFCFSFIVSITMTTTTTHTHVNFISALRPLVPYDLCTSYLHRFTNVKYIIGKVFVFFFFNLTISFVCIHPQDRHIFAVLLDEMRRWNEKQQQTQSHSHTHAHTQNYEWISQQWNDYKSLCFCCCINLFQIIIQLNRMRARMFI